MVLLFLGLYFILPYLGAWWLMKRAKLRWKKLGSESFGWRLVNGIVFLGFALLTFLIISLVLWGIKKMAAA